MKYTEALTQAHKLADIADTIGMKYFLSQDLNVKTKPDSSPVTQGDTEIEAALSRVVLEEYGDSYVGEEGTRSGNSQRRWLVDPIDGTKNFLRGFSTWGSLISLKEGDDVIAAVISAPAMGRRWWATKGGGSVTRDVNGKERSIHVSEVTKLENAFFLHNALMTWDKQPDGVNNLLALLRQTWRQRHVGDFLAFMYVAEGAADACFDSFPALWDIEAAQLIIEEAGGKVWTSADQDTPIDARRSCVASNGHFQETILEHLKLV